MNEYLHRLGLPFSLHDPQPVSRALPIKAGEDVLRVNLRRVQDKMSFPIVAMAVRTVKKLHSTSSSYLDS